MPAPRFGRSRGTVLVLTIMAIGIISIIAATVLRGAVTQRRLTDRYQLYTEELAIAELQISKACGEISYALQKGGATSPEGVAGLVGPARVPGYEVRSFQVALMSDVTGDVPEGEQFAGYLLRQLRYRISAHVRRNDARGQMYEHPGVALRQDLTIYYIPLSIFGIFSDPDLELHPGADFVENGRVHSNRNFHYGSDGRKFDVRNAVTVAGELIYGRHASAGVGLSQGNNSFWDGTSLVSARAGAGNIDSRFRQGNTDFAAKAMELWKGQVRDGSMKVAKLEMPWPSSYDGQEIPPSEYIQPAKDSDFGALREHKFVYKAGLFITRSGAATVATRADGTVVPLTYKVGTQTRSIVSTGAFYNEREGGMVSTLDVDLGRMREAGISPGNGMVFIENKNAGGAVRLTNGTDLPGDSQVGFSVATPNPMYVQGDYNTVDETLSMLAGDAVYILSNGWKDADNNSQTKRSSAPTASGGVITNAVIGAGNVPTQTDASNRKQYSGGVENFFRYMENWSGNTHTFKGSILLMFKSVRSTGFWSLQKYNPPRRDWSWNSLLARRSPPGAPVTFKTRRTGWTLVYE